MYKLIQDLIEHLEIDREEILDNVYPEDVIAEYVDSATPIMNHPLAVLLTENLSLGYRSISYDSADNAFQIIQQNVYEHLYEAACRWLQEQREG